jgi:ribonuclease-3
MKPKDTKELERALGHRFRRKELLEQALTHSSMAREQEALASAEVDAEADAPADAVECADNEQMEFLGDAVLGFVTSQALFELYPQYREGQLSKLRAYLVSEKHLIRTANKLKVGRYVRLGRGEEKSGGRKKTALQVDALEALLAALCMDAGLEKTRGIILKLILEPELKRLKRQLAKGLPITDYKSALQEALHSASRPQPAYVLVKEEGPQHCKKFTVEARIYAAGSHGKPEYAGTGEATTKKSAEQDAAQNALQYLWSLNKPEPTTKTKTKTKTARAKPSTSTTKSQSKQS